MPEENILNNRFRVNYVARQLNARLISDFRDQLFTDTLLNNLSMLFILRKKSFSHIEFLKNLHTRQVYDERIGIEGSPYNYIHELVVDAAVINICLLIGRYRGGDFGSIHNFANKAWGTDQLWRTSLLPDEEILNNLDRFFHLRDKLIAHVDLDLEQIIKEDDVLKLLKVFDDYLVPKVRDIFVKFLGHNHDESLDFEDMSVQTYTLLYPRGFAPF